MHTSRAAAAESGARGEEGVKIDNLAVFLRGVPGLSNTAFARTTHLQGIQYY